MAALVLASAVTAAAPGAALADPPGTNVNLIGWGGAVEFGLEGGGAGFYGPAAVHLPAGTTVVKVAGGQAHTLALTSTGDVYAWGNNDFGQVGVDPSTTDVPTPTKVAGLPANVVLVAAGGNAGLFAGLSLAVTSTGDVWAWGQDMAGLGIPANQAPQLCAGVWPCGSTPAKVPLPAGLVAVTTDGSVAAGDALAAVIATDAGTHTTRSLVAWGSNGNQARCGGGGSPSAVPLPAGITPAQVAAGADMLLVRTTGGDVYGCGLYPGNGTGAGTHDDRPEGVARGEPGGGGGRVRASPRAPVSRTDRSGPGARTTCRGRVTVPPTRRS